ncbi:MAG: N-acetylmuramoyl-L-alanine amidase [Chthoniobacterales bacterium]|nr:N-acetylmuramoyl-L-alanine amidase [Chthoniobacterales bacterium]
MSRTNLIAKPGASTSEKQKEIDINPAGKISLLGEKPDWHALGAFQRGVSKIEFESLLRDVYAPEGAWSGRIEIKDTEALVHDNLGKSVFRLEFAPPPTAAAKPAVFWRAGHGKRPQSSPLQGLRVAIDPGHLGGPWARMEERWYQIGENKPVTEGDMTLIVAKLLREELEARGAIVTLTREDSRPSTDLRPADLVEQAKRSLSDQGKSQGPENIRQESEKLFYRTAEIRARAQKVNKTIKPDIVLAVHFNAEPWGNAERPKFVGANHLHLLVTGGFTRDELAYDDHLYAMLVKLMSGCFYEENALAQQLAKSLHKATGLPPYVYKESADAVRVQGSTYVWARNLLANRLFECPVVYLEPYVMNNDDVHARVQAGDYESTKMIEGKEKKSIYREYVEGVVDGLVAYYSAPQ